MNLKLHRKDNQLGRIIREVKKSGLFNWGDGQYRIVSATKDVPFIYIKAEEVWR